MTYHLSLFLCALASLFLFSGSAKPQQKSIRENVVSSGLVRLQSAELHYIIEGKGLPCLVLGHSESYRHLLSPELRDHFRLIFLDLRHDARSKSSLGVSNITLDTYLNDIDTVSKAMGLARFAVFGHSHHAYVALRYAQKYPNRVSHVIMVGCAPCDIRRTKRDEFWESDASDYRKAMFSQKWGKYQKRRHGMTAREQEAAQVIAMAPKLLFDFTKIPSILGSAENDRDVYLHYILEILGDYDVARDCGSVTAPVFLALGRYDYVAPWILWDQREIAPFRNLSYNLFHRSAHFPMFEEQQLFDEKLIKWVNLSQAGR